MCLGAYSSVLAIKSATVFVDFFPHHEAERNEFGILILHQIVLKMNL